jgi:hypothetical protein
MQLSIKTVQSSPEPPSSDPVLSLRITDWHRATSRHAAAAA